MKHDDKNERIPASKAARICGVHRRTLYGWSNRGKVPGAAKLVGTWTYDEAELRKWIAARERDACQTTSINAGIRGGDGSKFRASTVDLAYEQALSLRPRKS
jgi:predicted DNA-binding transcriptional regulator AlpA